ncbi:MAG: FKBP-type peptidyl-prolyl cis-trans isomerase [Bacteroidales bacterium]|nr:FKBP-type peptidyl-prolyl cis-trans isomerase [Bacteroidales bacterium]
MKTCKIIAVAALLAAAVACGSNGGDANVSSATKKLLPSKAQTDSVSYLLGVNFGSFIKGYNFGNDINYSQVIKGIEAFVKAEGDPNDPAFLEQFKISPELMNDMFNSYLQKISEYTAAANKEKEENFLANNLKKAGFQATESGLQYNIITPGNDIKPTPVDTVLVHYVGTLPDGTVFDESGDGEPVRFVLDRVVSGWIEGLQLIGEGGKITLVLPSALAYGERGTQGIEPNTPLTFDVDLVQVLPAVAE